MTLGATYLGEERCQFRVWAPFACEVILHVVQPEERLIPMQARDGGYHEITIEGVADGSLYFYRIDGHDLPDPASRCQPQGVHGASQVVADRFQWHDDEWRALALEDFILYELHVGAFSQAGTFAGVIAHLDALAALGITAVELMPVAQFAGARNWGYDGVGLYAVQNTYGRPDDLRRLVDACHQRGMAVVLDVVYNHLGTEGNYLGQFAPYFTERYRGGWGAAINFDGAESDDVRRFFIENALYWLDDFHIDGLRLDATDAIIDQSAKPFLEELAEVVHHEAERRGKRWTLIAENDQNNFRLTLPQANAGWGMDGQWLYDFHHTLHPILTGEAIAYYGDFTEFANLERLYRQGFVYTGQYAPRRRRRWGTRADTVQLSRLIAAVQTHDRVGNRPHGERLTQLVSFETLKLAAAALILSPFVPLLFMGEEYGETVPFQFFTDFSDAGLADAVRSGRHDDAIRRGFTLSEPLPDPQDEATFLRSKLDHRPRYEGEHRLLWAYYATLIRLRKTIPALRVLDKTTIDTKAYPEQQVLVVRRWHEESEAAVLLNFSDKPAEIAIDLPAERWIERLRSDGWQPDSATSLIESAGQVSLKLAARSAFLLEKAPDAGV